MARSVHGVYRQGKVELLEPIPPGTSDGKVIVTFVDDDNSVDLNARGITPEQAADLRARLSAFEEDWQRPEMDIYDAPDTR